VIRRTVPVIFCDEGKGNGVFHVKLQVTDDQHVPHEKNF
jgi:hypothetical protein